MPRVSAAERMLRRQRALELRLAGASYREIGAQLGVSEKTAHSDVLRVLAETAQEPADQLPMGENTARPSSVISSTLSSMRRGIKVASNSRLCAVVSQNPIRP